MKKLIFAGALLVTSFTFFSTNSFADLPGQRIIEGRPKLVNLGNGVHNLYCPGQGGCAITWIRNGKTFMKIDGISGTWEVLSESVTPLPEDPTTTTFSIIPSAE